MNLFMELIIDAAVSPECPKGSPFSFVFIRPRPVPLALVPRSWSCCWRRCWSFAGAFPNEASV